MLHHEYCLVKNKFIFFREELASYRSELDKIREEKVKVNSSIKVILSCVSA